MSVRLLCLGASILTLASVMLAPCAQAENPKPVEHFKVEVMEMGDNKVANVGKWSPDLCKAFNAAYGTRRAVDAFTCGLPSPEPIGLIRPKWTNVGLNDNSDILIEWTFWQYWKARLAHLDQPEQLQELGERKLAKSILDLWESVGESSAQRILRDPPHDVRMAQRLVWEHFRDEVLSLIKAGQFHAQVAQFDLNRDGKVDQVYRITELNFEPYKVVLSRPKLRECGSQGRGAHTTDAIMVSQTDDPVLGRALWRSSGSIYDVFQFKTQQYAALRPSGWVQMGWIVRTSPSSYFSLGQPNLPKKRSIFLENRCQFNQRELSTK